MKLKYNFYKKRFAFGFLSGILLTMFLPLTGLAQVPTYEAVTVTNQPLRQGQTIQVQLDASQCGTFENDKEIYAVLFAFTSGKPIATDTLMKKGETFYTARFTIPAHTDLIAFKFLQNDATENNGGNGYFFEVADVTGQPQTGTNYSLFTIYSGYYTAGFAKSKPDLAKKHHNLWFKAQDLSQFIYFDKALALYNEKDMTALCQHLSKLPEGLVLSEDQFAKLSSYARTCGKETIAQFEAAQRNQYPYGRLALRSWTDSIRKLTTVTEKLAWIKAFQAAYPDALAKNSPVITDLYTDLFRFGASKMDASVMTKMMKYANQTKGDADNFWRICQDFAYNCFEKDTLINEALFLSRDFLSRMKTALVNANTKPADMSTQMYYQQANIPYTQIACVYGGLLFRNGQVDSALYYSEIAARSNKYKLPHMNEMYFHIAEKAKPAKEAVEIMKSAFINGGYNLAIKTQFVRLYNQAGLGNAEEAIRSLSTSARTTLYNKLKKEMLNQPAPDFTLAGLNGGEISLASLKGKVFLIDFWATWCKPCIGSFPAMQMLVDANKGRKDVAILFADTWQKEADKFEVVRKFFKDKPYRFDVFMDQYDTAVKSFKVSGIPTKIIVDKNGIIRFISVGSNANEIKTVEELQTMIDIAAEAK